MKNLKKLTLTLAILMLASVNAQVFAGGIGFIDYKKVQDNYAYAKSASKEYGFICLFTDGSGTYWFKVSRGFATAINESISSLEKLIDDAEGKNLDEAEKEKINIIYRLLNGMYE